MTASCRCRLTICTTVAALLIFFSSVTQVGNFSAMRTDHAKDSDKKYVIVFDGGSTGTRLHVFSFSNNSDGLVSLEDEYFQETKPGLSSFASVPHEAAGSLVPLIEKAKFLVPHTRWKKTPMALKATAGLRLLPAHSSDSILNEVAHLFQSTQFHIAKDSVSVLEEEDEGLFAWYTVNFLLGHLRKPNRSVATLDLGGGSTQVTFAPVDLDTVLFSPKGYVLKTRVEKKTIPIYSHSYLGLGLMSARLSILRSTTNSRNGHNSNVLRSPCIHPRVKVAWEHGMEEFKVMGDDTGIYGFEPCYKIATSFLNSTVDHPEELWKREIYALSYYFDRAKDLKIIGEEGGIVTVGEFLTASKKVCSSEKKDQPFLCLDACYITALLRHGLGFDYKKEITLVKKINGIETSWGLGAAFSLLR